jgi:hypothetical protein
MSVGELAVPLPKATTGSFVSQAGTRADRRIESQPIAR